MKISDLKTEFYEASGKVSDIVRQISFAGIAVVWIFKVGKDDSAGIAYTPEMRGPLLLFVGTLFFDLLQYVYKTAIWGALNSYHWSKQKNNEAEVDVSWKYNIPTWLLFWSKGVCCLAAYGELFSILYQKVM